MAADHRRNLIDRIRDIAWVEHELAGGGQPEELLERLADIREFLHELLADIED